MRSLALVSRSLNPGRHAVLAFLSERYPPLEGRSPTCYSPVRHSIWAEAHFAFDLHVLGTPPAFVLSQDQTLQLKIRAFELAGCSLLASCIPVRRLPFRGAFLEIDCGVRNHSSSWACYPVFKDRRPSCAACCCPALPVPGGRFGGGRAVYARLARAVNSPDHFFLFFRPALRGFRRRLG